MLGGVRHKLAVNHVPAELPLAAVVEPLLGPVTLRITDALADAVALILLNGRQEGEHKLGDTVAANVAAEIDEVQADLVFLQLFERFERIGGRAERAIKFRGDNNITRLQRRQQPLTFRTIRERVRDAKRHRAEQKLYNGGKRQFGWDVVDGRLVANANEQAALARAKALCDEGKSLRKIADALASEFNLKKLDATSVKRILDRA